MKPHVIYSERSGCHVSGPQTYGTAAARLGSSKASLCLEKLKRGGSIFCGVLCNLCTFRRQRPRATAAACIDGWCKVSPLHSLDNCSHTSVDYSRVVIIHVVVRSFTDREILATIPHKLNTMQGDSPRFGWPEINKLINNKSMVDRCVCVRLTAVFCVVWFVCHCC